MTGGISCGGCAGSGIFARCDPPVGFTFVPSFPSFFATRSSLVDNYRNSSTGWAQPPAERTYESLLFLRERGQAGGSIDPPIPFVVAQLSRHSLRLRRPAAGGLR